jgi:Zn-finger nucleic acid-binding protein
VITCPVCGVPCSDSDPETGEDKCPGCGRVWYATGNPEYPLVSRGRKVRLTKLPEPGDDINEVIRPVED